MKTVCRSILAIIMGLVLIASGCGPESDPVDDERPPLEATQPAREQLSPSSASSPVAYPGLQTAVAATSQAAVEAYPGPPTLRATLDPYPGGMVWILHPVGIQCEAGATPGYGDLREAQSTLAAAGIRVATAEMTGLNVTAACGSPTTAHYRAQIAADDLPTALSLGWTQE